MALAVWSRAADLVEAWYYREGRLESVLFWACLSLRQPASDLMQRGQREGSGRHGVAKNFDRAGAVSCKGSDPYQSSGVGTVNAEKGDRGADILGRGGIGAQTVEGRAGDGELLGGTEAGAGDASGHHRGIEQDNILEGGEETVGVEIKGDASDGSECLRPECRLSSRSDFFPSHVRC